MASRRARMLDGVSILANTVGLMGGPKDSNAMLERSFGASATSDGVSAAKKIELKD